MSERLQELQRQRALLQEHLAWLDREIATEQGRPAPTGPATPPSPLSPLPLPPTPRPVASAPDRDVDALLAQYSEKTGNVKQDVRRGCFLYFAAAFALVGLAVLALYLYSRNRH
ncbi:MAG: hypothetical protein HYV95_15650 [Opitutae bacterium]|nr:hypothetical protein [Opitutae bacterium]